MWKLKELNQAIEMSEFALKQQSHDFLIDKLLQNSSLSQHWMETFFLQSLWSTSQPQNNEEKLW